MPRVTLEQATAMMDKGFRHGMAGYPILFSDNGRVTVVQETATSVVVWEFETNGDVTSRRFVKEGKRHANISTGG
jgi:hypothetical protein